MVRISYAVTGLALLGLSGFILLSAPQAGSMLPYQGLVADAGQGEAVFWAAGCASCHMAPGAVGVDQLVLTGGQELPSPFGNFIVPNISTDPDHGIGGWPLQAFVNAVAFGISPDGAHYFPALPYGAYNKMAPQDMVSLKAFMDTLPASAQPSQPHKISFPFNIRRSLGLWKRLFVTDTWVINGDLTPVQTRGRYIVEAMAHCGECHTPRNLLGGLQRDMWLGGAPDPAGKSRIPNITPGGLRWSEAEIVEYLTTGFTPEFDSVGGHMAYVVENMARLPASDRAAIAAYLKMVPAVGTAAK